MESSLLGARIGILRHDLARQGIHIDTPIPKNLDAMVAIDNRSVGPHLE
jgi:hypothetical protein